MGDQSRQRACEQAPLAVRRDQQTTLHNVLERLLVSVLLAAPEIGCRNARGGRVEGLDRQDLLAGLQAVQPAFTAGVPYPGVLDTARLRDWAAWAQRFGIVEERPDVARAFAPRYANGG